MADATAGGCPDVLGCSAESALATLRAAGWRTTCRRSQWRGDLPGGAVPPVAVIERVLAQRLGHDGVVDLVVAGFAAAGPAPRAGTSGGEGG